MPDAPPFDTEKYLRYFAQHPSPWGNVASLAAEGGSTRSISRTRVVSICEQFGAERGERLELTSPPAAATCTTFLPHHPRRRQRAKQKRRPPSGTARRPMRPPGTGRARGEHAKEKL